MTGFVVQGHNDNVCSVYQNAFPSFTSQNTCSDRRTRFNPPRQSRGVLIMSHCVRRPSANVTSSRASCCPSPRCCRSVSRCVCDVVVIVSPWTRASPSPLKLSHSSTAFPFPSDLPRSQERQRVLEQHHGVSQGLRGVSRRGKLVCLWSFDSTVCCCIGATMKTINKRDMQ